MSIKIHLMLSASYDYFPNYSTYIYPLQLSSQTSHIEIINITVHMILYETSRLVLPAGQIELRGSYKSKARGRYETSGGSLSACSTMNAYGTDYDVMRVWSVVDTVDTHLIIGSG